MSRSIKNTLIVTSFLVSLVLLVAAAMPASAGENAEAVPPKTVSGTTYSAPEGPITVPVYPRGHNSEDLPATTDLRDSYIMLEDGSVLTMADWILGSLEKDKAGIGMSDYENRLFLGQVARAAVGMDEKLVNRSLVHARPTLAYKAAPAPKGIERAALSLASLVLNTILPGMPEGYDPSKSAGVVTPTMRTGGGDITSLSDEWLNEAIMHTAAELKESGTMQIMLKDQRKKLKQKED